MSVGGQGPGRGRSPRLPPAGRLGAERSPRGPADRGAAHSAPGSGEQRGSRAMGQLLALSLLIALALLGERLLTLRVGAGVSRVRQVGVAGAAGPRSRDPGPGRSAGSAPGPPSVATPTPAPAAKPYTVWAESRDSWREFTSFCCSQSLLPRLTSRASALQFTKG